MSQFVSNVRYEKMDFEGGDKAEPTLAQKAQDKIKNVKYDADEDGHHINGFNCIPRK